MTYNISLQPSSKISKEIEKFFSNIKNDLAIKNTSLEPHVSIVKFESERELSADELNNLILGINPEIEIELAGLNLLPSRQTGYWLEIPVLKTQTLISLQEKLLNKLNDYNILNSTGDRFRPHITLAKVKNGDINLKNLNYSLLRKKQIKTKIVIKQL